MQFVKEARFFYKTWSFWGILTLAILPFLEQYGGSIIEILPPNARPYFSILFGFVVILARFVKQSNIAEE